MKRVVTALFLIPFFLFIVLLAPAWAFLVTVAAVAVLCFHEFSELAALHGFAKPRLIAQIAGLLVLLLPAKVNTFALLALIAILAMSLALGAREMAHVLPDAAVFLLGVIYVFGALRCGIQLRAISTYWLFFALSLNWVGDIAALYVGCAFGRHKLAPNVSPGKSWEGSIASTIFSVVYAAIYFHYVWPSAPIWRVLALTVVANIAGQLGDLCESAFKRGAGVKDSGKLLPGHGGWLDRVDSSLFALPVVYLAVSSFGW